MPILPHVKSMVICRRFASAALRLNIPLITEVAAVQPKVAVWKNSLRVISFICFGCADRKTNPFSSPQRCFNDYLPVEKRQSYARLMKPFSRLQFSSPSLFFFSLLTAFGWSNGIAADLRAGLSEIDVTPTQPVRVAGYESRKELS